MNDIINNLRESRLRAYEASPGDIKEHFGIEQVVLAGGYGYRQVHELVQNSADAILEAHEAGAPEGNPPRIEILLADSCLYAANTGAPFSTEGIEAILRSHSSPKRGNQIGRFGLGFKSLLRLGGKIDITSGAVAFGFDPDRCRTELSKGFDVTDAPGLRLAWDLDEARADFLRERFPWATTVVCAEITSNDFLLHLRTEIARFPAEFLLFLPVRVSLTLNNCSDAKRELHRRPEEQDVILHDGEAASRWRVVEKFARISDQRAKDDATHIHTRDKVPLAWAMPLQGREEAGRFWAFFPTHTSSYLPGILNAPWKLNSDRNAVIRGDWNTSLMKEAAKLIVGALPQLRTDADPGRPLDAFPRQLERADEDAAPLVEALWTHLQDVAVIPDATGRLGQANELWLHPRENAGLARQWQAIASEQERSQMVHPSCLERQRGSRLKVLAERLESFDSTSPDCLNLRKREAKEWFAAVASAEAAQAIEVLKLVEAYEKDCKPDEWGSVRPTLSIVPCGEGDLLTPNQAVFAPEGTRIPDGRHPVAKAMCDDPEAKRILTDVLKVKPLDDSVWLEVLDRALPQHVSWESPSDERWQGFWVLLRSAPESARHHFATRNSHRLRVRRRDGEWVLVDEALLPGSLVAAEESSPNQQVLVDAQVHGRDEVLLKLVGVSETPEGIVGPDSYESVERRGKLLADWLSESRQQYSWNLAQNQNPQRGYIEPFSISMPRSWMLLAKLSGRANTKLTMCFLELLRSGAIPNTVRFGHTTRRDVYPQTEVPHPLRWFLLRYGTWNVREEVIKLTAIVARLNEPALAKLPDWQRLQPVLEMLKGAIPQVSPSDADIRNLWQALIGALATPATLEDDSLRELWAGAARDKVVPASLPTTGGDVALSQVFVTGSPDLARRARSQGQVVVTLGNETLSLWLSHGAKNLAELMKPDWSQFAGPATLLVSVLPELAEVLRPDLREKARCQPVAGLKLLVAGVGSDVPCLMWENMLILDMAQLALLSRFERFQRLLAELAGASWLQHSAEEALRTLSDAKLDELRAHVAQASTLAERLLRAVGGREEPLRHALGVVGSMQFLRNCSPLQLAELVLAQLGPATLTELKATLEQESLRPPSRWNTADARAFVASIGFPEEFAASPESRREPDEFISGPIELPPLHDFQQEVLEGIRTLVSGATTRRRAVVSLPTGGGKTRVTVEAAVQLILKPESDRRSVLWIAQTDELCEQALQAFRQVWLNVGAQRTDLHIIRLWGGNPNPVIQDTDKPVVVIASIQTLNSRMGSDGLAWLQKPGLVVVDECHHAITPSYTNLLRFLDAESPRSGAPSKEEPPILGLSATPFRTDDDESQRLARRFDSRWLPSNQAELHMRLRRQGVLAEVDHEALDSGVGLTEGELNQLAQLPEPREGIDFDNLLEAINQRLAVNMERNETLVERILRAEERSILLFANSVLHAEELAARLNLQGIPAAAVSGQSPMASRRYFLERFQRGEIHVLCNHTVLSTGFDAPKTDMVLISRAVFSPVRYMQMVGRGLRGEKNGGKARCRIVTVLDNLGRFQEWHPYHYCQKFFADSMGTAWGQHETHV